MKRLKHLLSFAIYGLVVVVLSELITPTTQVSAGHYDTLAHTSVCDEIELVLLVDQSGSMGGSSVHPLANDPLELRLYGPLFAIRALGNKFLATRGIPDQPQIKFSMAVIHFGDTAEVALDWTTLAPKNQANWEAQANMIEQQLSQTPDLNLGNTNFLVAFQRAADLFAERGPQQGGCPQRAVILLTDGEPAVDELGFSVPGHMQSIVDLVNDRLPSPGYRVYVTGINDANQPTYWDNVASYWTTISQDDPALPVPRSQLARTPDQIAERFQQILLDLESGGGVSPPPPVPPGIYVVPPYLQQLCLTFFKRNPQLEHLIVEDEIGALTTSRTDVEVTLLGATEPIETMCVRRPQPGRWKVETTANRADVLIRDIKIPTAGVLRSPIGAQVLQYVRTPIEIQLVDSQEGEPLPEYTDPRYQITITATVSAAGRSWPLSVRKGPKQTLVADFVPIMAGEHTLMVHGVAQDVEGKIVEVISGVVGGFPVSEVSLKLLSDPNTAPGGCAGPQQGQPLGTAYGLFGPDGKGVKTDVSLRWDVTATQLAGGQPVPITMQGPGATGIYSGTFVPEAGGPHGLHVAATLIEPIGGVEQQLLDQDFSFDVAPIKPIALNMVQPQPGQTLGRRLRFTWAPPFIQLEPVPLDVVVQMVDPTDGQPLDPPDISDEDPNHLLVLDVRDTVTGQPFTDLPPLRPAGNPGQFRAQIQNLDLGAYTVGALPAPTAPLRCGFGWATNDPKTEIERSQDPWVARLIAALALMVAGIVLAGGKHWFATRHPTRGWLVIVDAGGKRIPGGLYGLDGRNRHVFKGIPVDVGIKRLVVGNEKGWANEYRIKVQVVPLSGPAWAYQEMVPGKIPITNNYALVYVKHQSDIPN